MTPPTQDETAAPTDTLTVDRVQAYLWRYENDAAHTVAVACMRHWLDTHRSTPSPAGEVKCEECDGRGEVEIAPAIKTIGVPAMQGSCLKCNGTGLAKRASPPTPPAAESPNTLPFNLPVASYDDGIIRDRTNARIAECASQSVANALVSLINGSQPDLSELSKAMCKASRDYGCDRDAGVELQRIPTDLFVRVVAALNGINTQDAVNARRYRWLRHGDNDEPVILHDPFTGNGFLLRDEHLDAAIDAQLAALALANQDKP